MAETLAQLFRRLGHELQLNQQEFARVLGVAPKSIRQWARTGRRPSLSTGRRMVSRLELRSHPVAQQLAAGLGLPVPAAQAAASSTSTAAASAPAVPLAAVDAPRPSLAHWLSMQLLLAAETHGLPPRVLRSAITDLVSAATNDGLSLAQLRAALADIAERARSATTSGAATAHAEPTGR